MTSPLLCGNGTVVRGLGWDMNSPFSSPKGRLFSEASFGHTGYSGSSIWIDPKQDLFVILLTTRLNYQDIRSSINCAATSPPLPWRSSANPRPGNCSRHSPTS